MLNPRIRLKSQAQILSSVNSTFLSYDHCDSHNGRVRHATFSTSPKLALLWPRQSIHSIRGFLLLWKTGKLGEINGKRIGTVYEDGAAYVNGNGTLSEKNRRRSIVSSALNRHLNRKYWSSLVAPFKHIRLLCWRVKLDSFKPRKGNSTSTSGMNGITQFLIKIKMRLCQWPSYKKCLTPWTGR